MQPAACWPENTEKNDHKLHTMRAFDRIGILLRAILVACVAIFPCREAAAQKYSYGIDSTLDAHATAKIRARMDSIRKTRPTVALVLSGGGAKGAAHIGVLRYLEEIDMPVDLIVGTSMGGLIGGFYSAGHSSAVIDSAIRKIDWNMALSDKVPLRHMSYAEKSYKRRYNISMPFYYASEEKRQKGGLNRKLRNVVDQFDDLRLGAEDEAGKTISFKDRILTSLPSGLVTGQNVNNLFSSYTVGYHDDCAFWNLPIPFVCVATEMVSSKPKVWYSGKINTALRSTMAIPGLFTPVRTEGMVLLDGGMRNNYPTDIARKLGADYVIGVDLSEGYKEYDDLKNLTDIVMQGIDMLGRASYEQNTEIADVTIKPDISGYNMLSFEPESIDDLIARGEASAQAQDEGLMDILLKTGDPGISRNGKSAVNINIEPVEISNIEFSGISKEEASSILSRLKLGSRDKITSGDIEEMVAALYGTRYFDYVTYELLGREEPYTLHFLCKKGPVNQLGLAARMDSDEIVSVLLNVGLNIHNVNGHALELSGKIGTNPYASLHYYYRTEEGPAINVTVTAKNVDRNKFSFGTNLFNVQYFNERNEVYLSNIRWINLDINLGMRSDYYKVGSLMSGSGSDDSGIVSFRRNNYLSAFLSGNLDTLDDYYFPTSGLGMSLDYSWVFGAIPEKIKAFHSIQFGVRTVANLGENVALLPYAHLRMLLGPEIALPYINVAGGRMAGRYLDQQIPFVGITNAAAMEKMLAVAGAGIRTKIFKNNYITAIVNVGDSAPTVREMGKSSSLFFGAGLEYSYNSILGPIKADIHWSDIDRKVGFYLSLGLDF